MQNKELAKQIIDFHKSAFETGIDSMVRLEEQTFRVMDNFLRQSPWIPPQTKSVVNEWSDLYKKGAADFKEIADQNYSKLEEILSLGCGVSKSKPKQS